MLEGNELIKKAKGICAHIVERNITFQDYKDCLFFNKMIMIEQNIIRSINHNIYYTMRENKVALRNIDTKRFKITDTPYTLPWGYYNIVKYITHI